MSELVHGTISEHLHMALNYHSLPLFDVETVCVCDCAVPAARQQGGGRTLSELEDLTTMTVENHCSERSARYVEFLS
jgi:hypothetical protein